MRSPAPLPPELAGAPFDIHQAAEAGLTRRRTRAADLVIPFRGVRTGLDATDNDARCAAYAVRMPHGQVFSHATAARIWGLPLPRGLRPDLHVAVPAHLRQPRMRGVVGHRLGVEIPIALVRSFPVVAPCDAWCQLAESLDLEDLIVAGDRLVGWPAPLAGMAELDAAITRHGSRRGAVRLRSARREIRVGSASPRETRLRRDVMGAGFPEPECNGLVRTGTGFRTHGDLVFREWGVVLEYDGDQHRTDERQFDRDVRRLNLLALDGWIVIRVGRRLAPTDSLTLLDRALRSRGWAP